MYKKRKFRRYARRTRRPVSRRTRTTRSVRTRTTLRGLSRRVARIQRNFQPEFKFVDYTMQVYGDESTEVVPVPDGFWLVTASPTIGTVGTATTPPVAGYFVRHIPGLDVGNTSHTRVGQQVLYRNIQVTGVIQTYATTGVGTFAPASTALSGTVRIMVVMDTQARAGVFTDIVPYLYGHDSEGDYSLASRRNLYAHTRIKVIASRTYNMSVGSQPNRLININIPMRRVMHYGEGDTGLGQLNNRFYVIALANPTMALGTATPGDQQFAMRLDCRVRYVDS